MGSKKRSVETGGHGEASARGQARVSRGLGKDKALPGEPQSGKVDSLIWGAAILGEINALLSGSP